MSRGVCLKVYKGLSAADVEPTCSQRLDREHTEPQGANTKTAAPRPEIRCTELLKWRKKGKMQEEADRRRKENQKTQKQTVEGFFFLLSQHCYHTCTVLTAVSHNPLQHDAALW